MASPNGDFYQFRVMPFELNAPAIFQMLITQTELFGYLVLFAEAYLDDIIIHSNTAEDHINH